MLKIFPDIYYFSQKQLTHIEELFEGCVIL